MHRILVVDDEPMVRRLLKLCLHEGAQVVEAASADDAFRLMVVSHFDLLVTDNRMPGMSGVELIATARTAFPSTACILVSGHVDEATHRRLEAWGVSCIAKPFTLHELQGAARRALARPRLASAS